MKCQESEARRWINLSASNRNIIGRLQISAEKCFWASPKLPAEDRAAIFCRNSAFRSIWLPQSDRVLGSIFCNFSPARLEFSSNHWKAIQKCCCPEMQQLTIILKVKELVASNNAVDLQRVFNLLSFILWLFWRKFHGSFYRASWSLSPQMPDRLWTPDNHKPTPSHS